MKNQDEIKCTLCKDNIYQKYYVVDDKNYCPTCYRSIQLRCDICQSGISGAYYTSFGANVCKRCNSAHDNCSVCNRYISKLSNGGYRYGDKRDICGICYKSVIDEKELDNSVSEVLKFMASFGFKIGKIKSLEVKFASAKELKDASGICETTTKKIDGKTVEKNFVIKILYGLPKIHFEGILAHELFHMYSNLNIEHQMTKYKEEGTANLCQFLYLTYINKYSKDKDEIELSSYLKEQMLKNEDKHYGDGFRKAKKIFEDKGKDGVVKYINRLFF